MPHQFNLNVMLFNMAPKVINYLGNFCKKNMAKNFQILRNLVTLLNAKVCCRSNLKSVAHNTNYFANKFYIFKFLGKRYNLGFYLCCHCKKWAIPIKFFLNFRHS